MVAIPEIAEAWKAAQRIRPAGIMAYVDKVQLWLKTPLTRKQYLSLESQRDDRLHVHSQPMKYNPTYKQRLQLRQPSREEQLWLSTLEGVLFNDLELSLDWTFDSKQELNHSHVFVCKYHVKPWHGKQKVNFFENSRYTSRKRRVANNLDLYADKECRITGELYCLHMDWRVKGVQALRRADIGSIPELLTLDLRQFWEQRLIMRAVDYRALGRRFNMYSMAKGQLAPWLRRFSCSQICAYDLDAMVGARLARRCGSTQALIDRFRTSIDVGRCLVDIDVSHLLPSAVDSSSMVYVHTSALPAKLGQLRTPTRLVLGPDLPSPAQRSPVPSGSRPRPSPVRARKAHPLPVI
jgi:hypothetical protein